MATEALTCEVCGKEWEREKKGGTRPKYCSAECKQRNRHPVKKMILICSTCGIEWEWKVAGGPTPKSCSDGCRKKYYADKSREWRNSNIERSLELERKSRAKNAEAIRRRVREDRKNNPDRHRVYEQTKRARHMDRITSYNKKYYRENKEQLSEANREWRSNNLNRIRANSLKRKTIKRGAFVEDVDPKILLETHSGKCGICNGDIPHGVEYTHPLYLHVDHIVPLSKGGEHSYANTQPTHASCNMQKKDKLDGWQDIKPILNQEEQTWLDQAQEMTTQNTSATTSALSSNGASM